jgi:RNA polymerase sigma-70 factor (ECF subfamily)
MESLELPEPERHLLLALQQGEEKAFRMIYNEYALKLFSVAYNSTKSAAVAEEIVQEVFVSLWINRKALVITSSIKGYLLGAIRNKAFDYLDKQIVRNRYKNNVIKTGTTSDNSTEETIEFDDLNVAIKKEIQTLPKTTRHIFILSRFKGFSNSEIAEEYEVSVKAVEYHLTKALKHLRVYLKHVYLILFLLTDKF